MKKELIKLFFIIALTLTCIQVDLHAEKVIHFPTFALTAQECLHIDSISINTSQTEIHITLQTKGIEWINVNKNMHILTTSGEKLYVTKSDKVPFSPKKLNFDPSTINTQQLYSFCLAFPALPKDCNTISLIESENDFSGFNVYNIDLTQDGNEINLQSVHKDILDQNERLSLSLSNSEANKAIENQLTLYNTFKSYYGKSAIPTTVSLLSLKNLYQSIGEESKATICTSNISEAYQDLSLSDSALFVITDNFIINEYNNLKSQHTDFEISLIDFANTYADVLKLLSQECSSIKDYESATKCLKSDLHIKQALFGESSTKWIPTIFNLAECESLLFNYWNAIKLYSTGLSTYKQHIGIDELFTNQSNIISYWLYVAPQDEEKLQKSSNDINELLGDSAYIAILDCTKDLFISDHKYSEAAFYADKIMQSLPKDAEKYYTTLCEQALILFKTSKYDEAIKLCNDIIANYSDKELDINYAAIYQILADSYLVISDRFSAIKHGEIAKQMYENIYANRPEDPECISSMINIYKQLASYYNSISDSEHALKYIEDSQSLILNKQTDFSNWKAILARTNIVKAKIQTDAMLLSEASKTIEQTIELLDSDTTSTIYDYGNLFDVDIDLQTVLGNYPKAIALSDSLISIILTEVNINYQRLISAKMKKASLLILFDKIKEAESLAESSLEMSNKTFGQNHELSISCLLLLARTKYVLGENRDALSYLRDAMELGNNSAYRNNLLLANIASQKAIIEGITRNYTEAITNIDDAISFLEYENKRIQHNSLIRNWLKTYYSNKALIQFESEDVEGAKQTMTICSHLFEKESELIDYAEYLLYKGIVSNINTERIENITKACNIFEKLLGKENSLYANSATLLAAAFYEDNRTNNVESASLNAINSIKSILEYNKLNINSVSRAHYWRKFDSFLNTYIQMYALSYKTPLLCSSAYDAILYSKGFLNRAETDFRKLIHNNQEAINMYEKFLSIQSQINSLVVKPEAYKPEVVNNLKRELKIVEDNIITQTNIEKEHLDIPKWESIKERLMPNELSVEFVSFYYKEDSCMYMALCIDNNCASPVLIPLFEEKKLSSLILDPAYTLADIYEMVWNPILSTFTDCNKVYFSTSGILNKLPIENSAKDDSIDMYRLSSTNNIHRIHKKDINKIIAYGGLDFNADTERGNDVILSKRINNQESIPQKTDASRAGVEYLFSTKEEVVQIQKLATSYGKECTIFTDKDGTEDTFKEFSGKQIDIIHIASHGMYKKKAEDVRSLKDNELLATLELNNMDAFQENIMLTNSFIAMTGANSVLTKERVYANDNDGVLTAFEISQMDLSNIDLVVLSACNSGLGDITDEGVIGLQYGLKKAGANSILMSLDNVDDKATQLLMVEFYRNLLEGKTKHEALRNAQRYLRTTENGRYNDRKYWASFILIDSIN